MSFFEIDDNIRKLLLSNDRYFALEEGIIKEYSNFYEYFKYAEIKGIITHEYFKKFVGKDIVTVKPCDGDAIEYSSYPEYYRKENGKIIKDFKY
jgi:hypothetical protein